MVLKIPCFSIKEFQEQKIFTLVLNSNNAVVQEFIQKMKQRKTFLASFLQMENVSDAELIPILVKFLLINIRECEVKEFRDSKYFSESKYPVKLQILLKEEEEKSLESNFDHLKIKFHEAFNANGNFKIDNFFVIMQALYFADENEENFQDFAVRNLKSETRYTNGTGYDEDSCKKHCFVCGAEIMPGLFSYFATEKIKNSVCQK